MGEEAGCEDAEDMYCTTGDDSFGTLSSRVSSGGSVLAVGELGWPIAAPTVASSTVTSLAVWSLVVSRRIV